MTPQGISEVVAAENSANVEIYYRYASGRAAAYTERERMRMFPMVGVNMGRFVDMEHFAVEGDMMWAAWAWREEWKYIAKGESHLNPLLLFQRRAKVAQPQIVEKVVDTPPSAPPSGAAPPHTSS